MSKYQEALDELNRMAYGDCMGDEHIARIHSRKILQELVDMYPFFRRLKSKEKPLSPMLNKHKELVCRHCKESTGLYSVYTETDVDYDYEENPHNYYYEVKEKNSYCGNCGQALDWSLARSVNAEGNDEKQINGSE